MSQWKPSVAYVPCQCWSANHLIRIDIDPDPPDELNVAVVSDRDGSFWRRIRWAVSHVFRREDLVFADLIIKRDDLLAAIPTPAMTKERE